MQNPVHGMHGDAFADLVREIMALPLSDGEKAEAVRRLLAERADGASV